jgi:hypothetical protein
MQSTTRNSQIMVRVYGGLITLSGVAIVLTATSFYSLLVSEQDLYTGLTQTLMVITGVLIALGGAALALYPDRVVQLLFQIPFVLWLLAIFVVMFVFLYLRASLLLAPTMQTPEVVPGAPLGVGNDLNLTLSYARHWYRDGTSPYTDLFNYSPFTFRFFTPLLWLRFEYAYLIVMLSTLGAHLFLTLIFPLLQEKNWNNLSIYGLFLISGLFSHGLIFELERGQFNLIAYTFAVLAMYLFHYHDRLRWLAYVFFTFAVQLKLFPAIFGIFFITNLRDWRNNLKRILLLGAMNVACLFLMGTQAVTDYWQSSSYYLQHPWASWVHSHSIYTFVTLMELPNADTWMLVLTLAYSICLAIILFAHYQAPDLPDHIIDPYLLLGCTVGALIIPSASHDYKLSLLTAPVAFLMATIARENHGGIGRLVQINLAMVLAALYFVTSFSYAYKPDRLVLLNNFLPVFAMIIVVAALAIVRMMTANRAAGGTDFREKNA